MPNNVINKVVYGDRTLIDLTDTTADAADVASGKYFYAKDGVKTLGTGSIGGENGDVYQDEEGYIVLKPGAGTNVSVTPLSVTENGTYSAPTGVAYSPVSVEVEQGEKIPHYILYWDEETGELLDYATCDMTYQQILDSIPTGVYTFVCEVYQSSYDTVPLGASGENEYTGNKLVIKVMAYGRPAYVITHSADSITTQAWDYNDDSDLYVINDYVYAKSGYYEYDAGIQMPSAAQATPTMAFASATGLVTATATQTSGYVSAGTKSSTYQLPVKAAATYTPTETSQTISRYQWLTGSQTIAAISSTYVGTGVTQRSAADMTVNGSYVTAPSGYYSQAFSKAVSAGMASVDTITFTNAILGANFPNLDINSGTGVITGEFFRGPRTINLYLTSGYISSGSSGTLTIDVSNTLQLPVFAATTWTPSSTNQYISSYQWLTGSQTILGDTNLIASNIKSGVSIFGVNGTMEGLPSSITYLPETTIVATSFMNKYPLPDLIPFNAMPVDIIINGVVYGPDRQDWIDVTYGNNVYVYKTTSKGDAFATFSFVNRDDAVCSFVENGTYTCEIVYHPFEETEYGNTLASNRAITGTIDNIGYSYITITCDNTADKATYPYFEVTIGNVTKIIRAQDPYKYQFGNYYIDRFYYYSDSEKTISFWLYGEAESTYNFTITIKGIRKYKDTASVVNGTGIITEPIGGSYYNVSALEYIKIDRLQEDPLVSRTLTSFTNNNITMVGTGAFYYTTRLESVYLPKVKTISQSAFYYCQALNTVSLPNCSRIDNYAFFSAFSIGASLDLPNLTSMSNYAFGYARLGAINIPLLSSIPSMCFSNCYYLTSFSAPECKFISDAAFRFCSSLTEAVLPKVSHIGSQAFGNCYSLSHISAPECSSLGWSVFFSCSNLTQVYMPKVANIGGSCFYSCSLITSLNFPSCVSIAQGAFTYCSGVTSVSLPLCETLGQSVFSRCYALSSIYLPVCTSIGTYGFANCSSLTNISIPNVSYLGGSAFTYCINLSTITILKCSLFYAYTFGYCYNLLSLYLLNSSVTALSNVNAFVSTPISTYTTSTGGVNGSIFVPASLYDAYISATNWATYSSRFVSMTDAEIEAFLSALT